MTDTESRLEGIENMLRHLSEEQRGQGKSIEVQAHAIEGLRQDVLAIRQDLSEHRKAENNTAELVRTLTKLVEALVEKKG